MGLARSTYYDEPQAQPIQEGRLVERIKAICAEWPSYGYRRVTAELHATGWVVNHKKVMRLMKEHELTVRPRRRFVATTDSDHDGPIFPNLAKDVVPTGPKQLWVACISPSPRASSIWQLFSMAGRGAWSATPHRPACRCSPVARRAQSGNRQPAAAEGLQPPLRPRLAICCRGLPGRARCERPQGLDGPPRPTDGQIGSLTLSTRGGGLQILVNSSVLFDGLVARP
jgi:hypothetical protein